MRQMSKVHNAAGVVLGRLIDQESCLVKSISAGQQEGLLSRLLHSLHP